MDAGFTLPGHPWPRQLRLGEGQLRLPHAEPAAVRAAVTRSAEVMLPRGLSAAAALGGQGRLVSRQHAGRADAGGKNRAVPARGIEWLTAERWLNVFRECRASFPRARFGLAWNRANIRRQQPHSADAPPLIDAPGRGCPMP